MRPIELVLEGFRSYDRRTVFDWRERRLVGIVGPIGSGKSSLLDAITFALYGKTPVFERENKTLIREGRNSARVDLLFEVDGQTWRVLRVIKRRGAGQHALYRESALGPALVCDRERQVTEQIEILLGLDFQAFCRSVLLAQNRFAEFLHASPGDRDKVLKGVFGFDRLDTMQQLAKERRLECDLELRELEGRLRHVDEDRERLELALARLARSSERSVQLEGVRSELRDLERSRKDGERTLEELAARRRDLRQLIDRLPSAYPLSDRLERLELAENHRVNAESAWREARLRVAELEEEAAAVEARTGSREKLAAAAQELASLERTLQNLAQQEQSAAESAHEVETRRDALAEADRALEETLAQRRTAQARAEAATRTVDALSSEFESLRQNRDDDSTSTTEPMNQLDRIRLELDAAQRATDDAVTRLQTQEDALEVVRLGAQAAAGAEAEAQQRSERSRERLDRADEAVRHAEWEAMALTLARRLETDQPCPVCEQIVETLPPFRTNAAVEAAEAHRARVGEERQRDSETLLETSKHAAGRLQALRGAEERVDESRQLASEARRALTSYERTRETLEAALRAHVGADDFEGALRHRTERLEALEPRLRQAEQAARQAELEHRDAHHAVEIATQRHASDHDALHLAEAQQTRVEESLKTARQDILESRARLREWLGEDGEDATRLVTARVELDAIVQALDAARQQEQSAAATADRARQDAAASGEQREQLRAQLAGLAGQAGLAIDGTDGEVLTLRELDRALRQHLQAEEQQQRVQWQEAEAREKALGQRHQDLHTRLELEDVPFEQALAEARTTREHAQKDVDALRQRLGETEPLEARRQGLEARRATYHQLCDDLTPSRFLRFLLSEERTRLAALGSERFEMLSGGRYRFSDDGTFAVVDLANADAVRKSETLSGGESFLASLALALALAEKVTRGGGRLDAFFLDEGFGSLDPEHFDLAMEGIERLVADSPNRLVTVVSHVPEMRQRLEDLIVLAKDPRNGATVVRSGGRWRPGPASKANRRVGGLPTDR